MSRVAMYDVNVYANTLRDVLIRIDVIGLVQAKWTDRILEETFDNLKATRQDLSAQQLDWTRGLMNVAYLPRQSRRRQNSSSPRISTTSRCTWWPSSVSRLRKAAPCCFDYYEFTFALNHEITDEETEALFEPFDGGAVPEGGGNGPHLIHVEEDGYTLAAAISAALAKVEALGIDVIGVESEDAVSTKDIAERTGRTYESVRMLATGKRGPGGFPVSFGTEQWALYSWAEVSAWLAQHYGSEQVIEYDRQIAAADHLLRARRILGDGQHRAEMAQLVTT